MRMLRVLACVAAAVPALMPWASPAPAQQGGAADVDTVKTERAGRCLAAFEALPPEALEDEAVTALDTVANADLLRAYDRACLERFADLKPHTRQFVAPLLVLLTATDADGNERARCAGFRLSPETVATAGHCLRDPSLAAARHSPDWAEASVQGLAVRPFTDPQRRIPVETVLDAGLTTDDFGDWAVLRAPHPDGPAPPEATVFTRSIPPPEPDREPPYTPLLIPSVSIWALALDAQGDLDRWPQAMRVDRLGDCSLTDVGAPAGCLVYRCQTLGGMSGSPVLGFDFAAAETSGDPYEGLRVIGLHLRPGELDGECGLRHGYNVGRTLPSNLLQRAGTPTTGAAR